MILQNVANRAGNHPVGVWLSNEDPDCFTTEAMLAAATQFRKPAYLVQPRNDGSSELP